MDEITKDISVQIEKNTGIKLDSVVDTVTDYGLHLVGALAIFFIGRFVARRATKLLKRGLQKTGLDKTLISFFCNIVYFTLLAFILIAALSKLGVQTTSFAAAIAAAGLAVGLALQGSLSNFAAGVLIIIFRPFRAGDYIEVSNVAGDVDEISLFTTTLTSPDNKKIIVPNSQVTNGNIVNYSAYPKRRVDMVFSADYDDDLPAVKKLFEKILKAHPLVLEKPEPMINVAELGASSVNFNVRPWVKTADYWTVKWAITEQVKLEFDKAGFSIPYPHQTQVEKSDIQKTSPKKAVKKKK